MDLSVFAGTALASLAVVLLGHALGLGGESPLLVWLLAVVCIDVAHVWSTVFRVYLDGEEVRRRAGLYLALPLAAWALGVAAHAYSPLTFWRLLAYVALWHFIRQQYGWVALYGRRAGASRNERWLDGAAVYAATLGPAIWWHANLPRAFWWFVEGDFLPGLPPSVGTLALALHGLVLGAWLAFQVWRLGSGAGLQVGKVLLVLATWGVWFGGIVVASDDFAFTVFNVALHGIPYFALLWRYAQGRAAEGGYGRARGLVRAGLGGFLAFLIALAFAEEWLWDRLVWGDHPAVFGATLTLPPMLLHFVVPLLALPQVTHYLLDAFIWKPSREPRLMERLGWTPGAPVPGDSAQEEPTVGVTLG